MRIVKNILKKIYHFIMLNVCSLLNIFRRHDKKMEDFKNKHKGKRCFIVSTGPSLKLSDLELIKNEFSISTNSIINLFDKTDWRPNYYLISDEVPYRNLINRVNDKDFDCIFLPQKFKNKLLKHVKMNINYSVSHKCRMLNGVVKDVVIPSKKIYNYFNDGMSVVCIAIQLAAFMGFEEIYFLGQDCDYSMKQKHSILTNTQYGTNVDVNTGIKMIECFENYFLYFKYIKFVNCTRGGKLNCIERKELEDVISHR